MGLTDGFQWLDGSFVENVELLEARSPRDIDVVTFVNTPVDFDPTDDHLVELHQDAVKNRFLVDSYIVELNQLLPANIVERSAYWYSVWSHRRNQAWKGYLQIDLSPALDADARQQLNHMHIEKKEA